MSGGNELAGSFEGDAPENSVVSVTGQHVDLGSALGAEVDQLMRDLAAKYFRRAAQASVVFSREAKGRRFRCNIRFLVAGDIDFAGQGVHRDAHRALALATEHVAKQLRRTKRAKREDKAVNVLKRAIFERLERRDTAFAT